MKKYVYLAVDGNRFKVGCSNNPIRRVKELRTASPTICLTDWWPCGHDVESFLHKILRSYHIHGEWFDNSEDVMSSVRIIMNNMVKRSEEARKAMQETPARATKSCFQSHYFAPSLSTKEDPVYVALEYLSTEDLQWNMDRFRAEADAIYLQSVALRHWGLNKVLERQDSRPKKLKNSITA